MFWDTVTSWWQRPAPDLRSGLVFFRGWVRLCWLHTTCHITSAPHREAPMGDISWPSRMFHVFNVKYSNNPSYSRTVVVSQYPVFSFLFSESSAASLADWQGWNGLADFPQHPVIVGIFSCRLYWHDGKGLDTEGDGRAETDRQTVADEFSHLK